MYVFIATLQQPVPKHTAILYSLNISQKPFCSVIEVHNMKLISLHSGLVLFFIFFLIFSSKLDARPLTTEQGQNRKFDVVSGEEGFVLELEGGESSKLLGMEDCNSGDEEYLMRRMTLEAHLDYIYTQGQHHKP